MKTIAKKMMSLLLIASVLMLSGLTLSVSAEPAGSTAASSKSDTSTPDDDELAEADQQDLEEQLEEDGKMDMDVIFVLDASGSMLYSDPNKVAFDAFNLFVDLLDDTCGAGYVVFTQTIKTSANVMALDNAENQKKVRNGINSLSYDPSGDTDISLGLTKAMNLFKEKPASSPNKRRSIILLTDGNTDLPNGPRTVAESKKELEGTLKSLKEMDIPVYSIGLNYDGSLDKDEIANISGQTGGRAYQTKKSSGLVKIASDIFGDVYDLEGTQKEIVNGDVKIDVKDNTVFYVNVIIRSNFSYSQLNPILTDPSGKKIDLSKDKNIRVTSTSTYTLLKLIYPDAGTWNLHLSNVTPDNCTVTQMDFYSIYVKQEFSATKAAPENTITITATLNDSHGKLKDSDLLRTIQMTTTITGESGDQQITLTRLTDGSFTGRISLKTEGVYSVKTKAKGNKFQKSSRSAQIRIGEEYYFEQSKAQSSTGIDTTESSEPEEDKSSQDTLIYFIIGGVLVAGVVVVLVIISRNKKKKPPEPKPEEPKPAMPKPTPPPVEPPPRQPKYTEPQYLDYERVEHESLDTLIRKGPEDAFQTGQQNYEVDESLSKLIRRGEEDPFNAKGDAAQVQSDSSLEKLIRRGEEDPFNTNASQYQSDAALENLIHRGEEDPFNTNAGQYQSDASLEQLIRRGEEDPFGGSSDNYQTDPSLAGIIKAGEEGLTAPPPPEETDDDDDFNA